jgi:hypothetical protein
MKWVGGGALPGHEVLEVLRLKKTLLVGVEGLERLREDEARRTCEMKNKQKGSEGARACLEDPVLVIARMLAGFVAEYAEGS